MPVTQRKSIARALVAAFIGTALASCSAGDSTSSGSGSGSVEASGISLDRKAERQLREALAQAPMHGLKASLFLTEGDSGEPNGWQTVEGASQRVTINSLSIADALAAENESKKHAMGSRVVCPGADL